MSETIPEFRTDEEAERFVERADLSQYDLTSFVPTRFEFRGAWHSSHPVYSRDT